jgi:hypothetical protein
MKYPIANYQLLIPFIKKPSDLAPGVFVFGGTLLFSPLFPLHFSIVSHLFPLLSFEVGDILKSVIAGRAPIIGKFLQRFTVAYGKHGQLGAATVRAFNRFIRILGRNLVLLGRLYITI